ncbi:unnamed protein product [Caenorhabditis auriculariae]|uniref:Rad4 beta-hairpin domain-containing protein n=1 Tax=Caenorhabditis auriculariae TaxID=2777116 RepID=A0A8S1HB97_9PELO|nr:unnamed protein product [Caenorhabditis auriculariae]
MAGRRRSARIAELSVKESEPASKSQKPNELKIKSNKKKGLSYKEENLSPKESIDNSPQKSELKPAQNVAREKRKYHRKKEASSDDSFYSESCDQNFEVVKKKKILTKKASTGEKTKKSKSTGKNDLTRPKGMREAKKKRPRQPWQKLLLNTKGEHVTVAVEKKIAEYTKVAKHLAKGRTFEITFAECVTISQEIEKASDRGVDLEESVKMFLEKTSESKKREDDDESEDEWEEMEDFEPLLERLVEVNLGGQKEEEYRAEWGHALRSIVNRLVRESWENVHKAQILGFIAHLRYIADVALFQNILPASLLSLVPDNVLRRFQESKTADGTAAVLKWFKKTFKEQSGEKDYIFSFSRLFKCIQKCCLSTSQDVSVLFFCLLHALGATVRLCVACHTVFRRWDKNVIAQLEAQREQISQEGIKAQDSAVYWIEIWSPDEERWICVDPKSEVFDDPKAIAKSVDCPITYVLAIDNEKGVSEVAHRYALDYIQQEFRRRRTNSSWISKTLHLPGLVANQERAKSEKLRFEKDLLETPVPSTLKELKNHPLFVLKRDLLKYQGIYPPPHKQKPVGCVRGHKVYPRSTVFTLLSEKEEKPYKMARIINDPRLPKDEEHFEPIFGFWQTETYRAPPLKNDGSIPCDHRGRVPLFQPLMCPQGTVHLNFPGLIAVARHLNKPCRPALVGYDKQAFSNLPVLQGACVLAKDAKIFTKHAKIAMEVIARRNAKIYTDRVYGNWRKLIRGILRLNYVQKKFGAVEGGEVEKKSEEKKPFESEKDKEKKPRETLLKEVPNRFVDNTPRFVNLAPLDGFSHDDLMQF